MMDVMNVDPTGSNFDSNNTRHHYSPQALKRADADRPAKRQKLCTTSAPALDRTNYTVNSDFLIETPDNTCGAIVSNSQNTSVAALPYDTCFGVVRLVFLYTPPLSYSADCNKIHATTVNIKHKTTEELVQGPNGVVKISLSFHGSTVVAKYTFGAYLGLLETQIGQVLSSITLKHSVVFDAFIDTTRQHKLPNAKGLHLTVSILLYGFHSEFNSVGNLLSERGVYLQHPRFYDIAARYDNPQYLRRPGAEIENSIYEIPAADQIALHQSLLKVAHSAAAVFDEATGPTHFSEARISSFLVTDLKR